MRFARPGIGVASQPLTEVSVVPSDIDQMGRYLRAPLDQLPGLAAVCQVAFFEKLPLGWKEIRADSWHQPPPADLPIGEDRMVYLHGASGCMHSSHPHDPFYRTLVRPTQPIARSTAQVSRLIQPSPSGQVCSGQRRAVPLRSAHGLQQTRDVPTTRNPG